MADEKSVREKWDAFVAEAKAATHLAVCPGASITAPVRISQIAPAPAPKAAPEPKFSPKKDDPKPVSRSPMFGGEKKDNASE